MNADILLAVILPITLFCIMLGMGTRLTLKDFRVLLQNPASMLVGVLSQMLLLPLVALALLYPLNLPFEIFAGFIILALSPGGTTSNMFSYLAKGNLALSVSLTAFISLVTPVSIPLIAGWFLGSQLGQSTGIELPFLKTLIKLALVTLFPVAVGMLLRHYQQAFCLRNEFWITRIPLAMLLLVITGIILQNRQQMPDFIAQTGIPALLLASLALLAGYWFARCLKRSKADSHTIAIETAIQNGGTAILVTGTILQNPAMTVAPVMYGILMLVPVFLYLLWLRVRRPEPAS